MITDIKNIVLLGHTGEGKTSVAEAMLFNSKATDRLGKIAEGNTIMDFDEQEIQRKISISLSCAYLSWKDVKINLIDAPGFFDFAGEQMQAISACDGAIVVISSSGLAVGSEQAIDYCLKKHIPLMIFINQMDKENADYLGVIEQLKNKYNNKIAPIEIPIMEGSKMRGYTDVLAGKAFIFSDQGPQPLELTGNLKEQYETIRFQLTEVAAESDDALLEKYFAEGNLSDEEVIKGVKRGIADIKAIPVVSGSALFNKGIINLLNSVIRCMPSYKDRGGLNATTQNGDIIHVDGCNESRFSAQIFKTIADPFVGKMNLFKVLSGEVKTGSTVMNTTKNKQERINSILILRGKKQELETVLSCGDIGAFAKLQYTGTGDTLAEIGFDVVYPNIETAKPVISMAAFSVKSGEEDKIFSSLNRLSEEDITFNVNKNIDTGEMLLSGLGETHLDVIVKRLKNKFGVEAELKMPKIAYRETIKQISQGEGKHKKQSGGHGQYGHCKIRFEPYKEGVFKFEDEVVGGTVPKQYIPAVEKGLKENITKGVLLGYPVVNLKAVLHDGSYHDVDSSEEAFKLASSLAFKDGLSKANPILLEPIFSINITVPENYIGDIMGDMNKRRGKILGMETTENGQIINAEAPQSEIIKYSQDLRSMTQGRGSFETQFLRYEELPKELADKLIASKKTG